MGSLSTEFAMPDLIAIDNAGDRLELAWSDGRRDTVFAVWLRDNSPNPKARHANGQKLFDITDLADDVAIASTARGNGALDICFAPDGHEASFDLDWLRRHGAPANERDSITLWGAELADDLPVHDHEAVAGERAARRAWLQDVRDLGFAVMTNVPLESGTVCRVAELFGFVRETNYGRFFEVRTEPDPINLAYTPMGLSCHTDNPYRDPVPGLQLLHCLAAENDGGESVVVDGFKAAALLREEAPDDFAMLTRHAVPFRFASTDAVLEARARLITLDDRGEIAEIRFNNRSIATFDLAPDVMPGFYRAYRRFARILQRPALEVGFKLKPGELFIVDNRRVLHGRKTVGGSGRRHLQGCYADKDSLLSTLRLLEAA
jgi:gamma-butyrobetaine dioxygenase